MNASAPHIFTLTGNLLAERTLHVSQWSPGRTHRATHETFQVGGKGINVAKMLTRLRCANTAVCFVGGAPGAECEAWLRERGFNLRAFATVKPTRCGTVIRDGSGVNAETTFLGPDAVPDEAAVTACADFLEHQPDGHVLAVCGSFPGWSSPAFGPLRNAILRWSTRGVLIVDTYGPPLADLIAQRIALLKINADELQSLQLARLEDLPKTIEGVVVSDGPRAVRGREPDGTLFTFTPPQVREISATGSGDVLLACILEAWLMRKLPLRDAVAFAIPYAAANAAHPGIAEFPRLPTEP